jgi:hypothetical protein
MCCVYYTVYRVLQSYDTRRNVLNIQCQVTIAPISISMTLHYLSGNCIHTHIHTNISLFRKNRGLKSVRCFAACNSLHLAPEHLQYVI